jgi:hypothetical protein
MDLRQILCIDIPYNRVDELINFWGINTDDTKVALISALFNICIKRLYIENQIRITHWLELYAKQNIIFARVYLNIKPGIYNIPEEVFINKEFDISTNVPIHVKQFFVLLIKDMQQTDIDTIISNYTKTIASLSN